MLNNWNIRFWEYDYFAPNWLWLLALLPLVLFIIYSFEKKRTGDVKYSRLSKDQRSIGSKSISRLREIMLLIYGIIAVLLIIAMAKPYHWNQHDDFNTDFKDGIDIILAMDVSMSMMARDFEPNRLEASKKVAKEFIDGRTGDRIGLVVYAGEAYTACPATLDYNVLKEQVDKISGDRIEGGTAIGTGLGTAVTRLRNDSIASKVIILLTDGSNNSGEITPQEAAELAKAKNIRVYTIGVGRNGTAPSPVITPFGVQYQNMAVEIDEVTLMQIAETTNGQYFRATDTKSLQGIYKEIESLEKRKMEDQHYKSEPPSNPQAFLNWALVLAVLVWSTNHLVFRHSE